MDASHGDGKIHALQISNFMGVRCVSLNPDGTIYEITGANSSGKTSIVRAIWAALGGADYEPEQPIRAGQEKAEARITVGDLIVTKRWTRGSQRPTLTVTTTAGLKYPSPQKVLDALIGRLSFDPLEFDRLDDGTAKGKRAQAAMLRQLAGLDTSDLDAEAERVRVERAPINQQVDRLRALVESMPAVPIPEEIGEERSATDLMRKQREALGVKQENDAARGELRRLSDAFDRADGQVAEAKREAERIERLLNEQRAKIDRFIEGQREIGDSLARQKEAVANLTDPDLSVIQSEMEQIEAHNASVRDAREAAAAAARKNAEREARLSDLQIAERAADEKTARLAAIDAERAERLAKAKFPIAGLSVDGDVPIFEGVPLSQINTANRIRIGLAVGAALNPGVRFVTIEHGNDLDGRTMPTVAEWAAEHGYQVIVERIEGTGAPGVELMDGEAVEAKARANEAAKAAQNA